MSATMTIDSVLRQWVRLKQAALGSGRTSAVLRTGLTSIATRAASVLASLLTVPLVLHHVGPERYGVWMAAISLSAFFSLADGGVTKGLIAEVAKAHGADDRTRIRILVASALATTLAFGFFFVPAALITVGLVDWTWAFNLSRPELGREAAAVVATICLTYGLSYPVTVIRETRLGMLQGAAVNLWDLAGLAAGFFGLVLAVWIGLGLWPIAAIWSGCPMLARWIAAIVYLGGAGRDYVPSLHHIEPAVSRVLVASGAVFVTYTLLQALAVQSDQILIARFLGAGQVANYAVVQRLFLQPQVLITLGLAAQWPAYGEALGRGDMAWIRKHLTQSLILYTTFAIVVCGLLAVFCRPILHLWVGDAIVATPLLVLALMASGIMASVANVFAFFLLSVAMHRPLIMAQALLMLITLPLSMLLIPRLGPPGAAIAAAAGYALAFVLPGLFYRDRLLSRLQGFRPPSMAAVAKQTT